MNVNAALTSLTSLTSLPSVENVQEEQKVARSISLQKDDPKRISNNSLDQYQLRSQLPAQIVQSKARNTEVDLVGSKTKNRSTLKKEELIDELPALTKTLQQLKSSFVAQVESKSKGQGQKLILRGSAAPMSLHATYFLSAQNQIESEVHERNHGRRDSQSLERRLHQSAVLPSEFEQSIRGQSEVGRESIHDFKRKASIKGD